MTIDINNETGMKKFTGLAINPGRILAPVCLYSAEAHNAVSEYSLRNNIEVIRDIERFDKALKACSIDLDNIKDKVSKEIGLTESEIFLTQKHILNDPAIVKTIRDNVKIKRKNVESIISEVYKNYENKFASMNDSYLKERSADIGEIRRRLLDKLSNNMPGFVCTGQASCSRGKNRIIVAKELTAEMMVNMDLESVLGIVTEHGGISSHAAIIARSVGIPAVSGAHDILQHITCGTKMLVDGNSGTVFLNPTKEIINELIADQPNYSQTAYIIKSPPNTKVLANASMLEDVLHASKVQADGIGLFRTEIYFLRKNYLVPEDEQFKYYSQIQEIMGNKPITFRLLDIGGDKPLPFLKIEKETNPYLGWRGSRFLLGNTDIFKTQVGALVRLSANGPVNIMFPMVIDDLQMQKLIDMVQDVISTKKNIVRENIKIGAMFEVPSACIQADTIFKKIDFASIGSNDLIQYLFAVDRNNENVAQDFNPYHPALWSILENLSNIAKKQNKPLSICGEMATIKGITKKLLDIGITELSVSSRLIPNIRKEMSEYFD